MEPPAFFLIHHGVGFIRCDHPPVFTCAEAERLVPPMDAARTKNVFLRDRKGTRHYLVVVGYHKSVDVKALAPLIGADRPSLASPERLLKRREDELRRPIVTELLTS